MRLLWLHDQANLLSEFRSSNLFIPVNHSLVKFIHIVSARLQKSLKQVLTLSCELSSASLNSRHQRFKARSQQTVFFFFSYLAFLEQSVNNLQSPASKGYTTSDDYQPRQSFVPHLERQWISLATQILQ